MIFKEFTPEGAQALKVAPRMKHALDTFMDDCVSHRHSPRGSVLHHYLNFCYAHHIGFTLHYIGEAGYSVEVAEADKERFRALPRFYPSSKKRASKVRAAEGASEPAKAPEGTDEAPEVTTRAFRLIAPRITTDEQKKAVLREAEKLAREYEIPFLDRKGWSKEFGARDPVINVSHLVDDEDFVEHIAKLYPQGYLFLSEETHLLPRLPDMPFDQTLNISYAVVDASPVRHVRDYHAVRFTLEEGAGMRGRGWNTGLLFAIMDFCALNDLILVDRGALLCSTDNKPRSLKTLSPPNNSGTYKLLRSIGNKAGTYPRYAFLSHRNMGDLPYDHTKVVNSTGAFK